MSQHSAAPLVDGQVLPEGVRGLTKAERVRAMFAQIATGYDFMNSVMTFGLHRGWRKVAVGEVEPAGRLVLDVGTGTGDLAIALARAGARSIVAVDFCAEMLPVGRAKAQSLPEPSRVRFLPGDALHLPFPDETFDAVANGFLLRNVADLDLAFQEMVRVLKPGGRLVCLEITHPPRWLAPLFGIYFGRVVPVLGKLITGQAEAYRYLPASLGPLPEVRALAQRLAAAGLVDARYRRLGLGTVAVHVGRRPLGVASSA